MEMLVETEITCPHCGETFPLQIDTSQSRANADRGLQRLLSADELNRFNVGRVKLDL